LSAAFNKEVLFKIGQAGSLGFGGAAIGNLYRPISEADAFETVRAAFDAGVRYFDTAPHYGFGLSEKRLGAALSSIDVQQTAIISTKVGRRLAPRPDADLSQTRQGFVSPEPFESEFDYSYDAVMFSYEDSLEKLKRDRIDILYVHDLGTRTHGEAHAQRFAEFMNGGYRALRELRDSGAVGAIGLGVNEWQICEEALAHGDYDVMLLAGRYTLLEQSALETFLPLCARRGVSIVLGGPYNSGILARGVKGQTDLVYDYQPAPPHIIAQVAAIESVCDKHNVTLPAAALQFPLAHPQVIAVIPGMNSPAEVSRAREYLNMQIPAAFWRELRERELLRPEAPVPSE
jgi:D-threo-aldose 1-dehydrogenase